MAVFSRNVIKGIVAVGLAAAILMLLVIPALAWNFSTVTGVSCNAATNTITIRGTLSDTTSSTGGKVYVDGNLIKSVFGSSLVVGAWTLTDTDPAYKSGVHIQVIDDDVDGVSSASTTCAEQGEEGAPGIWLADVCEPLDGFSSDGWMTLGSNANSLTPNNSTLYVAASEDGPWFATGFTASPYIVSHDQIGPLAAMVGVVDYHAMWVRGGETGTPAKLGSLITDRGYHIGDLCGE